MRILTTLPQDDLTGVPAAARAAEAAGYDSLVTSENRNDPFLSLGIAAVNTSRVGLCTGIAIAFSRSPMPVANAKWDQMSTEISDDVVRLFAAVATHRELAREIERRFGGVTDAVTPSGGYGVRQDIPPDLIQDICRIPSVFIGFQTAW